MRPAGVRNRGGGSDQRAPDPHQNYDEHRQPRRRLQLVAAPRRGHWPGPDGVHHQQPDLKIHPMALVNYDQLKDRDAWKVIRDMTHSYSDKREYFVDNLSRGIGKNCGVQYPHPVIVRMSDFKTNEYADLIGGAGV